jgi:type II secretory pathway pseudopilin PulG
MNNKEIKIKSAYPKCMKHNFCKRGYTIIEMMIAISLFIIIIMTGMEALLNANLLHQKSQSMRSILDNLSFVMEDMSRNLRTGYHYRCVTVESTDLSAGNIETPKSGQNCWGIAFEYQDGIINNPNDQWVYFIDSTGKIFKATSGPYNLSNFIQLTPDEISIDVVSSVFNVEGAEPPPGDSRQPFVTIKLVGNITFKNIVSPFSLQTSVSQRQIDI